MTPTELQKNKTENSIKHWLDFARKAIGKKGSDQFEIYLEDRRGFHVDVKNQEVDSFIRSQDQGIHFRILKNKKLGHSFSTTLSESAILEAIDSAFSIMKVLPEDEHHQLFEFDQVVYPEVNQWNQAGLAMPVESKIKLALDLEKACKDTDKRIVALRSASFKENQIQVWLSDSHGNEIQHQATRFSMSALCKSQQDQETQTGFDFQFAWDLSEIDPLVIGKSAASDALELLGAVIPKSMKCPVIIPPRVMADLIDFIAPSMNAEAIDKKKSMLIGKLHQKVFSDQMTLIDDGLYPNGLGTTPFDGEGVPKKKLVLFDQGEFVETYRDLYYASKNKAPSTASTHRSIQSKPSVSPSNLYLKPGKKDQEALICSIDRGVLVTHLMGLHTANPITGQFSLGANGRLIEKGKLSTPLREFAVAGSMFDLFSRIDEVGSDLRFFGTTGAPSVLVSELSIGGKD